MINLGGRSFTIKRQFLDDLENHRTLGLVRQMRKALLIFHAPADKIVDVENAAEIFRSALHPKSYVSLDRADHMLTRDEDSRYVGVVLAAWASRYLDLPAAATGTVADAGEVARTGSQGFATEVLASGHALIADEPASVGVPWRSIAAEPRSGAADSAAADGGLNDTKENRDEPR